MPNAKNHLALTAYHLSLALALTACDGVFDYHPYDTRFDGDTDINATNIARIEAACRGKDTLRVAFISDTHGWYSDTDDMISDINRRENIDFVMHCGDLTDTGTTKEFVWTRERLDALAAPYVTMIGNHDFLGTGDDVYLSMFGPLDFAFTAGRVRFVCLNTNATEYDYLAAVPNFDFLEAEIGGDTAAYDRTILCMHARPYSDQFNNNVARAFEHYVTRLRGIMFCIAGHDHRTAADDLYDDGIIYYGVDCAKHRNYHIFTITPGGYDYEIVGF